MKQKNLFPGVEEQRVAIAGWLVLRTMESQSNLSPEMATWNALPTKLEQFQLLLRAASRLLFDGHRLGKQAFIEVDRGIFEGARVLPRHVYQMLYDAELVMLSMLANDWRGIVL
jgi:hypothetical protein